MTTFDLPNNSRVAVHDLYDPLPEWMARADVVFTDIPYNQSLLTNYAMRPEAQRSARNDVRFEGFLTRLFDALSREIMPQMVFVECGKQSVERVEAEMAKLHSEVVVYKGTYYRKAENVAYVVRGRSFFNAHLPSRMPFDGMDEADMVAWLCANAKFDCIGDLCMGKGLVGREAYKNGCSFVGTELNPARLQVLVDWIGKQEAKRAKAAARR